MRIRINGQQSLCNLLWNSKVETHHRSREKEYVTTIVRRAYAGVLPKIIRTNGVGMLDDIPRTVFLCLYGKGTLCVNIDTSLIVSAFER